MQYILMAYGLTSLATKQKNSLLALMSLEFLFLTVALSMMANSSDYNIYLILLVMMVLESMVGLLVITSFTQIFKSNKFSVMNF